MVRQAAAFAVLFALLPACHKDPKVYVECRAAGMTLASGFACTLDHQQGDHPAYVCWDLQITCQNGAEGTAHGCGKVDPMSKSSVTVPFNSFGGALDKCDAIAGSSVGGLSLIEVQ